MNIEEYLRAVIRKNPAIARQDDAHISLTARGLRSIIRNAFAFGEEHGREQERTRQTFDKKFGPNNPFSAIMSIPSTPSSQSTGTTGK